MKTTQALKEYLLECEVRKYTKKTIKSYRNNLELFLRYLDQEGITDTEDILPPIVKKFTLFMTNKGKKGTYINGLLKTIKSFINYIYGEGYGGFNTKNGFKWCKEDKIIITTFKPHHVKKMLSSCNGSDFISIRDKAILSVLFETGIRCWELCCITPQDIHEDFILINGKNHKQRVVPITPILKKALIKYQAAKENYFTLKNTDDYYFLSFHGKQLNNSAVEHILKRHGEGIEDIRVSPHTCRHFFAQTQVKLGTDLYTISRLLGHENLRVTQVYLNSLRNEDVLNIARQNSVLMNL
jgi:integrase/recombinase XerD